MHNEVQAEFDIIIDDCEFPALVNYIATPELDALDVTKCLFNVSGQFWAQLEPEHFGVIEKQLREKLLSQSVRDDYYE